MGIQEKDFIKLTGVHGSSPLSFYRMIRAITRNDPFRYNGHGNWCGRGGGGPPVDQVDRCCQMHDECYQNSSCRIHGILQIYDYKITDHGSNGVEVNCYDPVGTCKRTICQCDYAAAGCFSEYPPP